ncbi:MAG TPA: exosortase/archaeosortase family protein [Gemmatimonadaceae bacterium]|jgi:exosortase|nr:exosortase [Gemmatimonadota bacterium]HNV74950.1 exosortase/archaeosortase family protein [Gemmatimonadaceae bacterium]HPV75584.1 exosortase/archaeosortase family protein [Gemmatimonadaceae bacterium]
MALAGNVMIPSSGTISDLPAKERTTVALATSVAFLVVFADPLINTMRTWWSDPEAGHGLLLAPLALWLAWQRGRAANAKPLPLVGVAMLVMAVVFRYVSALAAEAFVGRASMFLALAGLVVWGWGVRQLMHWWLPVALLALSVPLPDMVMGALALPLQFKASQMGAAMLATRGIPVHLDGNVIRLPGHDLFVTEACSGLRSLTALLSLGVLLGGLLLKKPASRVAIVALSIPVAVVVNGVRVFITGFLVAFVDPKLAEGFSHMTEGWLLFLVAFAILGAITWVVLAIEERAVSRATASVAHE